MDGHLWVTNEILAIRLQSKVHCNGLKVYFWVSVSTSEGALDATATA
jgi:hypothetical protein